MTLTIGFKTDIGRVREVNEDSYAVLARHQLDDRLDSLIVVADGMGGGRSGDVASGIVAQTLPETVHEIIYDRSSGVIDPNHLLRDTIMRANSRVWMRAVERKELRGMGTTCVAAIIKDDKLIVGNVGDSRAYLLRDGQLRQITEDHSEVWLQVKAGNMTREQAAKSRYRNSITRAIGLTSDVEPDMFTIELREGDTVLLCTDGLTTEVNDKEIARILATAPDANETCDRLVASALRHGGSDNVTVVVARYGPFTPLVLPDAPSEEEEEDEAPTDPVQEWRNHPPEEETAALRPEKRAAPARNGKPAPKPPSKPAVPRSEPRFTQPPGYDEEDEEERMAHGGGGFAIVMIVLLLVTVVALGAALGIALRNRTYTIVVDQGTILDIQAPTDRQNDYPTITPFLENQAVLDAPLVVSEENGDIYVYVVSAKDQKLLKIDMLGRVTKLDSKTPLTTAGPLSTTAGSFAIDASRYRWQINPTDKCIDKYTGNTGSIRKQFGKSELLLTPSVTGDKRDKNRSGKQPAEYRLHSPTSVAIDKNANIYVIDNHHLYRMDAVAPFSVWEQQHFKKNDPTIDPASP